MTGQNPLGKCDIRFVYRGSGHDPPPGPYDTYLQSEGPVFRLTSSQPHLLSSPGLRGWEGTGTVSLEHRGGSSPSSDEGVKNLDSTLNKTGYLTPSSPVTIKDRVRNLSEREKT